MKLALVRGKLFSRDPMLLQIVLEFTRAIFLDEALIDNVMHLGLLLHKVTNIVQVAHEVGMSIPLLWSKNTALQKPGGARGPLVLLGRTRRRLGDSRRLLLL